MYKFGQVISYDEKSKKATIEYIRPDACAKCGACGMLNKKGTIVLKAECKPGDWVRVSLPESHFLSAAAIAYLLPLAGFLVGLFAGYYLSGKQDLWTVLGGIIGLILCGIVLLFTEKRIAGKPEWTPQVDAVYEGKPDIDAIGCHGRE